MKKRPYAVIFVGVIFIFSLLQYLPLCYALEKNSPADPTRVLTFLSDVVGLDLAKYDVILRPLTVLNYSDVGIIGNVGYIQTSGIYALGYYDYVNQHNSILSCRFSFADATLTSCDLDATEGTPLFSKSLPSNPTSAAATFLERYETFTGDKELSAMRDMLTNLDATKNSTKTVGSIKVTVTAKSSTLISSTLISWNTIYNNVEYPGINVEFKDEVFSSFADNRARFTIGKTDVNISEQQAIDIALKRAETFSYTYSGEEIANFSIVKDQIRTELITATKDKPGELYPCWTVYLPLSKMYPGSVSVIRVTIWADNGEIASCDPITTGGPVPGDSEQSSANNQTDFPTAYIAIAIVVVLMTTIALVVLLKKRKRA